MGLRGLPDFRRPLGTEGFLLFSCYEDEGFVLLPDQLEIARRDDGSPDLSLELVLRSGVFLPADAYGVLDLRLRSKIPAEAALAFLRQRHPQAMVTPASFRSGYLRLQVLHTHGAPPSLPAPTPLGWNGLGQARYISRLTVEATHWLKGALQEDLLAVLAAAEVELAGVSPVLPLRVRFDPAALLATLATRADSERRLAREQLEAALREQLHSRSVEVVGDEHEVDRQTLVEALADRIQQRWGTPIPSPELTPRPYLALAPPDAIGAGRFEWDLSEPVPVSRVFVLRLDPLEAARGLVRERGLDAVFRQTMVPALPTGALAVSVSANLPPVRPGVIAMGATLRAPPRLPWRFQAAIATVELAPPKDTATAILRISSLEEPEYRVSTFVILQEQGRISRVEGPEFPHRGDRLYLGLDLFPAEFLVLEADPSLLQLATVRAILRRTLGDVEAVQAVELDLGRPQAALALPHDAGGATLAFEARERGEGRRVLRLGPMPAVSTRIGLYSFPEYGPHAVEVRCTFDGGAELFAIDLLPEERAESPEGLTVLALTPERPTREWRWRATSPFTPGYRYRPHPTPGEPPALWSESLSPFEPLVLRAVLHQEERPVP
ncbi:MAG: hypothetical protein JXB05_02765 [Myxococcaceae bacterium]|nr:hypothetical protein [Myxococcaceae bacterium]